MCFCLYFHNYLVPYYISCCFFLFGFLCVFLPFYSYLLHLFLFSFVSHYYIFLFILFLVPLFIYLYVSWFQLFSSYFIPTLTSARCLLCTVTLQATVYKCKCNLNQWMLWFRRGRTTWTDSYIIKLTWFFNMYNVSSYLPIKQANNTVLVLPWKHWGCLFKQRTLRYSINQVTKSDRA
jgi:hypothetical protein